MPLGVWIQFLEPSLSTRGVASNSFQGSRRSQPYHLLRLKSFPLLKQPKKWFPLECCCKQWVRGIPLDPLGMPQQTIGEMGLRMFNDAQAAISMGKMDGLLRRVRHLELACDILSTFAQNSQVVDYALEGWRESLRRLNQVSQTIEFVDQFGWSSGIGPRTNRSRIQLDQKLLELDSTREWFGYLSGPAIRGIQEGDKQVNLLNCKTFWLCHPWYPRRGVCFKDLLALPLVGIQEGKSSFAVHDIITFLFSFVSSFITSWNTFMWCMWRMFCGVFVDVSPYLCYRG